MGMFRPIVKVRPSLPDLRRGRKDQDKCIAICPDPPKKSYFRAQILGVKLR